MPKELINGILWTAAIIVAGIALLFLASHGSLPNGFGLFDMEHLATRIVVFLVLVAIMAVLGFVYVRSGRTNRENDR